MMDIRIQVNQARGQFNFRWALPCPPSISATLSLSWLLPSSSYLLTKATTILRYFLFLIKNKTMLSHYFLIQTEIDIKFKQHVWIETSDKLRDDDTLYFNG